MRPLFLLLLALGAAACARDPEEESRERRERARALLPRLAEPGVLDEMVDLREIEPLLDATAADRDAAVRELACLGLGALGGDRERQRLHELLAGAAGDDAAARRLRLFARAGLRLLRSREPLAMVRRDVEDRLRREEEAALASGSLDDPDTFTRVVELGGVWTLLDATTERTPWEVRREALLALGRVGGPEARDRLVALLHSTTGEPERDGPLHLYAAAGLTLLADPGSAIDLLLNLSRVNPNDYLAARAAEGQQGSYWTIDAQICEALLRLGLWEAEEDLVEQLQRKHYVRVLIDAWAVLRRHTGLDLPFRYNGSYDDRAADAAAWLARLRETRAQRYASRPFDVRDPAFRARCAEMMDWLRGQSVNNRYIAQKVVQRLGPYAVPFLLEELASPNPIAQRQAALMLGRIGDPSASPGLRAALGLEDADARAEVIESLRVLGDAEARPEIAGLLADADAEVRTKAAAFLGQHGLPEDRAALRDALGKEHSPATRTAMLAALLRLGDASVAEALVEVFRTGEQHDREAALRALEEASGRKANCDALAPEAERARAAGEMAGWFREK